MTRLKPRQATLVLYHGDDMNTLAELKRAADHAATGNRKDAGAAEQAAFDAFLDEATQRAVEVVLQSIGRRRWRDIVAAHPPRMVESEPDDKGKTRMVEHDDDLQWGVNTETFPRALLTYVDRDWSGDDEAERPRTIVAPEFADAEDLASFIDDEVPDGDVERMWLMAFALNADPGRSPKAFGQRSSESTT